MNILEKIVVQKGKRLEQLQESLPFAQLVKRVEQKLRNPQIIVEKQLKSSRSILTPGTFHVIAEIKRASPSKGRIPWALPLEEILHQYETGEASLLSVLTEEDFFLGSSEDFQTVRQLTALPLLRKDFLFTEYQLYESALLGADAILLIASLLEESKLRSLIHLANQLSLQPLVECRNEREISKALNAGATFLGINNRDLRTFEINLRRTEELSQFIPKNCLLVSESGIHGPEDAARASRYGADAILVGESCVRSSCPAEHIRTLLQAGRTEKLSYKN